MAILRDSDVSVNRDWQQLVITVKKLLLVNVLKDADSSLDKNAIIGQIDQLITDALIKKISTK